MSLEGVSGESEEVACSSFGAGRLPLRCWLPKIPLPGYNMNYYILKRVASRRLSAHKILLIMF